MARPFIIPVHFCTGSPFITQFRHGLRALECFLAIVAIFVNGWGYFYSKPPLFLPTKTLKIHYEAKKLKGKIVFRWSAALKGARVC